MDTLPTIVKLDGGWFFKRFVGGWFLMPPDGFQMPISYPWTYEEVEILVNRLHEHKKTGQ